MDEKKSLTLKKVVAVYYETNPQTYETGLVLELEDGTMLRGQTTDVLKSFEARRQSDAP